jgi:hypothetical protein
MSWFILSAVVCGTWQLLLHASHPADKRAVVNDDILPSVLFSHSQHAALVVFLLCLGIAATQATTTSECDTAFDSAIFAAATTVSRPRTFCVF